MITGDLVKSGSIIQDDWSNLLSDLKSAFTDIGKTIIGKENSFEIYRGDSFQCLLEKPQDALLIALLIRAKVRSFVPSKNGKKSLLQAYSDVRISLGIGTAGTITDKVTESKGTAFELSGRQLDRMKKKDLRILITTTDTEVNSELYALCMLADAVVSQWSPNQAEVIYRYLLENKSQQELAAYFGISQPAIRQRLVVYGKIASIEAFLDRYRTIIEKMIQEKTPK